MLLGALCIYGCQSPENEEPRDTTLSETRDTLVLDLPQIKERGKLVLLTENSSISYFLYRGQAMGFDYELVKDFARSQNLELEVRVMEDLNDMFDLLNKGKGDLIACNLNHTVARESIVDFSNPLTETQQVIVQRKPESLRQMPQQQLEDTLVRSLEELNGHEIYVHEYSSFFEQLKTYQ